MQQIAPTKNKQRSLEKSLSGYVLDEANVFLHTLVYTRDRLLISLCEIDFLSEDSGQEEDIAVEVRNFIMCSHFEISCY